MTGEADSYFFSSLLIFFLSLCNSDILAHFSQFSKFLAQKKGRPDFLICPNGELPYGKFLTMQPDARDLWWCGDRACNRR
jgi:hypothetical protein